MCKNMPPLELAIQFHGHICPGLLIGVRAAEFAQKHLDISQDYDEELLAIVETDSCGVDAIQAILGCTFGKGNLIFNDYGKNVYTIASRDKNRAVRIAQKYGATSFRESERFRELNRKQVLSEEEAAEKENLTGILFEKIMTMPVENLFTWEDVELKMPGKAQIHATRQCAVCGEGVMETRTRQTEAGTLCIPCYNNRGGEA
ncbi:MAG: TraR/DksA C4-type zinc finger protein [Syntrophomonadaceae bacterium]|nr:TraR/DksA C4-type zinc finger protein [Syntrophomonadaceae bacterium]